MSQQMIEHDFLSTRSIESAKREISNILDSYHHYWDLLSELLQNASDAIRRRRLAEPNHKGRIDIEINQKARSIIVRDNGCGITEENLKSLLAPGYSDKGKHNSNEVGEKGVGITFCLFSTNRFKITTKTKHSDPISIQVDGANSWLHESRTSEPPKLRFTGQAKETTLEKEQAFCIVELHQIVDPGTSPHLFDLNFEQLKFIIQTKTAIGDTSPIWDQSQGPTNQAFLHLTSDEGTETQEIEARFPWLHQALSKSKVISLEELTRTFTTYTSEKQKTEKLRNRTIFHIETIHTANRNVKVYGIMFPGHIAFKEINVKKYRLLSDDEYDNKPEKILFEPSIILATKNISTGVTLERPTRGGKVGYYQRCFFLVEDDKLNFDVGRKSLHHRTKQVLQDAVKKVFARFEPFAKYQAPASDAAEDESQVDPELTAMRRQTIQENWAKYASRVDIKYDGIRYQKQPSGQEAAVVAIFHELIGCGDLDRYYSYASGYSSRYDLYCKYDNKIPLIVEFKYRLESIISDLESDNKYYADIDLLVVWEYNEQRLRDHSFSIDAIDEDDAKRLYQGVTHKISHMHQTLLDTPMPVIVLNVLIDQLRKKK